MTSEHDYVGNSVNPRGRTGGLTASFIVESILGCKWSICLLRQVADGCRRPSGLLRANPGLSTKVMNERLRKMIKFGIVERSVIGEVPPIEVRYELTLLGLRFMKILEEVSRLQKSLDEGVASENEEPSGNDGF